MKDLIAKLHLDANCALGAIWMHIDAQAARIAELEAQIAAASEPVVEQQPWKSLNDVQWMNIVNHDHAYFGWDKEDAVHHAVKATEAKLRELNSTALQAPVREVPGWQPIETAPKDGTYILLGSAEVGGAWIGTWVEQYLSGYRPENPWSSMMLNVHHLPVKNPSLKPTHWMPLPAAPVQPEGEEP